MMVTNSGMYSTQRGWYFTHQIIFDLRAGVDEEVPDGGNKEREVRSKLLIILLSVHCHVVTDLRLDLLQ